MGAILLSDDTRGIPRRVTSVARVVVRDQTDARCQTGEVDGETERSPVSRDHRAHRPPLTSVP